MADESQVAELILKLQTEESVGKVKAFAEEARELQKHVDQTSKEYDQLQKVIWTCATRIAELRKEASLAGREQSEEVGAAVGKWTLLANVIMKVADTALKLAIEKVKEYFAEIKKGTEEAIKGEGLGLYESKLKVFWEQATDAAAKYQQQLKVQGLDVESIKVAQKREDDALKENRQFVDQMAKSELELKKARIDSTAELEKQEVIAQRLDKLTQDRRLAEIEERRTRATATATVESNRAQRERERQRLQEDIDILGTRAGTQEMEAIRMEREAEGLTPQIVGAQQTVYSRQRTLEAAKKRPEEIQKERVALSDYLQGPSAYRIAAAIATGGARTVGQFYRDEYAKMDLEILAGKTPTSPLYRIPKDTPLTQLGTKLQELDAQLREEEKQAQEGIGTAEAGLAGAQTALGGLTTMQGALRSRALGARGTTEDLRSQQRTLEGRLGARTEQSRKEEAAEEATLNEEMRKSIIAQRGALRGEELSAWEGQLGVWQQMATKAFPALHPLAAMRRFGRPPQMPTLPGFDVQPIAGGAAAPSGPVMMGPAQRMPLLEAGLQRTENMAYAAQQAGNEAQLRALQAEIQRYRMSIDTVLQALAETSAKVNQTASKMKGQSSE